MYFLLNMGIFHCYVSLPEAKWLINGGGVTNHLHPLGAHPPFVHAAWGSGAHAFSSLCSGTSREEEKNGPSIAFCAGSWWVRASQKFVVVVVVVVVVVALRGCKLLCYIT